jgi:hypothetical protein
MSNGAQGFVNTEGMIRDFIYRKISFVAISVAEMAVALFSETFIKEVMLYDPE